MNRKIFEAIVKLTQNQLTSSMYKILKDNYGEKNVINHKGNLYAKGTIPILLIAHMDTVFKLPPEDIYFDQEKRVMWSPDGLGADDRAGVYAILHIIQLGYRPSILLCRDEEQGCIGATEFIGRYKTPPTKINYMIELDRHGKNDCVFYDTDNPEFIKYIENFGFKLAQGTYSDVLELGFAWKIPGVNLSVGYYDEHFYSEILKTNEFDATIEKVMKMLDETIIPTFKYIPKKSTNKCFMCGDEMTMYEDYTVRSFDKKHPLIHVCPTCLGTKEEIKWCPLCQGPYVGDEECCPKCLEEMIKNVGK